MHAHPHGYHNISATLSASVMSENDSVASVAAMTTGRLMHVHPYTYVNTSAAFSFASIPYNAGVVVSAADAATTGCEEK